jgi:cell division protein FtsQ
LDGGGRELQQIGRGAKSSVIAVDPRRGYIAPRRAGSRALAPLNRQWILHRQIIIRVLAALLCAAVIAIAFQARGGIMLGVQNLSHVLQGEFAEAGLGVEEITITGQALTGEKQVLEMLGLDAKTSILGFDAGAARERLMALPAITEAHVRKIYPNQIEVALVEKQPVARWRLDGVTSVIDGAGTKIGVAQTVDDKLPLIIGAGAGDDATIILRALERYPDIAQGIAALSRLADRRWDMIYKSGLRVRLPEHGVAQALKTLNTYQVQDQILDRDVSVVDMRVHNVMSVRPITREE